MVIVVRRCPRHAVRPSSERTTIATAGPRQRARDEKTRDERPMTHFRAAASRPPRTFRWRRLSTRADGACGPEEEGLVDQPGRPACRACTGGARCSSARRCRRAGRAVRCGRFGLPRPHARLALVGGSHDEHGRCRELLGQALRGGHACDPIDERRAVQRYLGGVRQLPQRPRRSAASVKAHRFTGFWHPVAWAVLVQGATPSTRSVKVAAVRFGWGSSLGEEGVELLVALDHAVLHAAGDHPVATLHGVDDR